MVFSFQPKIFGCGIYINLCTYYIVSKWRRYPYIMWWMKQLIYNLVNWAYIDPNVVWIYKIMIDNEVFTIRIVEEPFLIHFMMIYKIMKSGLLLKINKLGKRLRSIYLYSRVRLPIISCYRIHQDFQ
jgi:hypothetical protein